MGVRGLSLLMVAVAAGREGPPVVRATAVSRKASWSSTMPWRQGRRRRGGRSAGPAVLPLVPVVSVSASAFLIDANHPSLDGFPSSPPADSISLLPPSVCRRRLLEGVIFGWGNCGLLMQSGGTAGGSFLLLFFSHGVRSCCMFYIRMFLTSNFVLCFRSSWPSNSPDFLPFYRVFMEVVPVFLDLRLCLMGMVHRLVVLLWVII
jgi:hypothetical protein